MFYRETLLKSSLAQPEFAEGDERKGFVRAPPIAAIETSCILEFGEVPQAGATNWASVFEASVSRVAL